MCQCVASSHPRCQAREVAPNRGGKEVTMVSRWTCVGGEEDIKLQRGEHQAILLIN